MLPWGYTDAVTPDHDWMMQIAKTATDEIKRVHGQTYKYGTIPSLMYKVSGNAIDWVYDELRVKASFAVELRDTGTFGFLLPPEQIRPTAEEVWAAMQLVFHKLY